MKTKILVLILVVAILIYLYVRKPCETQKSPFGADDENYALAALEDLDEKDFLDYRMESNGQKPTESFLGIEEVDEKFLAENADRIQLIKEPVGPDGKPQEDLSFYHPVNTEYWPNYYYTTPYQYRQGGAWPPNMQSRLYNWQPGFGSGTGWSYWLRPGITYDRWPRNRWVKQNGKFFYINNGPLSDRLRDFTGEPS